MEATDEKILNLFIKLSTHERKLIMSAGSIKNFLAQSNMFTVDGNTLAIKLQEITERYELHVSMC